MNHKVLRPFSLKFTNGCERISASLLKEISYPAFVRIFSISTIFFTLFLIVACILLPWQQVSVASGKVIAFMPENREQSVDAPVSGRIKKWFVHEGQYVTAGTVLAELEDIDADMLVRIQMQINASRSKLDSYKRALEVSQKNYYRQQELAKKGISSQRDVELTEIEISKLQTEIAISEKELVEVQSKLARQQSQTISASRNGLIAKIFKVQGGEVVSQGSSLAILVPETNDRSVELFVNGNDIPLISAGRKVRIQFEGWPAVQFAGWPSIAVGTFGGVVKFVDVIPNQKGLYRVVVFEDPEDRHKWPDSRILRQGVNVIGWILLDQVSLGWELWRRLNGFPQTVENSEIEKQMGSILR